MIKVLHVTNCYPSQEFPDYGMFIKEQVESLNQLTENRIHIIEARKKGIFEYLKYPAREDIKWADVIHFHHVLSLLASLPWLIFSKKRCVISFLNEFEYELEFGFPKKINRLICHFGIKFCDRFIYKSDPDFKHNKLVYLPNGVKQELIDCPISDEKKNRVFFVSSKNPDRVQKRLDLFQDTLKILRQEYNIYPEIFVASGLNRETYIRELKSSAIHFLCSDYEGSPNSVKEAMACNVAVLSRDVGNVSRMFSPLNSPYYKVINSDDPNELARGLSIIFQMDFSKNNDGKELIRLNKLSHREVAHQLVKTYNRVNNPHLM